MRRPGTYIDEAALVRAVQPGLDDLIDKAMDAGIEAAQDLVPVDTGELHDGIEVVQKATDGEGTYGVTDVEYALHVEFGTQNAPAQPYLRPSIDLMKQALQ